MVDAQEKALISMVNFGVHETHRFTTLTGHFYGISLILGNVERFAASTANTRAAFEAAMQHATAPQRGFASYEEERCSRVLETAGVELLRDDEFDRPAFVEAAAGAAEATARNLDSRVAGHFRHWAVLAAACT